MKNNDTITIGEFDKKIWFLQKWNYKTHKYDYETICGYYYFSTYETDMEKLVNCPHCKKIIRYGDCYTSLEYHNSYGIGLAVCEDCYEKEWDKRRKYRDD